MEYVVTMIKCSLEILKVESAKHTSQLIFAKIIFNLFNRFCQSFTLHTYIVFIRLVMYIYGTALLQHHRYSLVSCKGYAMLLQVIFIALTAILHLLSLNTSMHICITSP